MELVVVQNVFDQDLRRKILYYVLQEKYNSDLLLQFEQ